jgi:hypothetical protein
MVLQDIRAFRACITVARAPRMFENWLNGEGEDRWTNLCSGTFLDLCSISDYIITAVVH